MNNQQMKTLLNTSHYSEKIIGLTLTNGEPGDFPNANTEGASVY